jgi:hypothetical protein
MVNISDSIPAAIAISILLVLITTGIFYEMLCIVLKILGKRQFRTRPLMFFLVLGIFSAHTVAVWTYGAAYWILVNWFGCEPLGGTAKNHFFDYIYFSAATYSSLGIGDVFPHGVLRFITGVEVLNGLILIGWSVIFTYFAVEKLWRIHANPR